MVSVRIICIGSLKERFFSDACAEYEKRLKRFANIKITELKEAHVPDDPSDAEINRALEDEGARILDALKSGDARHEYVFACAINGKTPDSIELAERMSDIVNSGSGCIAFVIGGSHGLSRAVIDKANMPISFSRLTFPHQLFRVMLMEQIYRAFKIINGEKYHK